MRLVVDQCQHKLLNRNHLVVKLPDLDVTARKYACKEMAGHLKKYLLKENAELLVILKRHIEASRDPRVWIRGGDTNTVGTCAQIIVQLLLPSGYTCQIFPEPGAVGSTTGCEECSAHFKEICTAWARVVG